MSHRHVVTPHPVTRRTGAASEWKQRSWTRATISDATEAKPGASHQERLERRTRGFARLGLPWGPFVDRTLDRCRSALRDAELRPGDVVVMRDGAWTDQAITFENDGRASSI